MATAATRARSLSTVGTGEFPQLKQQVTELLTRKGTFSDSTIHSCVDFFFEALGLPRQYFEGTHVETIAKHVSSLQAARELATSSGKRLDIELQQEEANSAFFAARSTVVTDRHGGTIRKGDAGASPAVTLERYIESKYLHQADAVPAGSTAATNLQSYTMAQSQGVFSLSAAPGQTTTVPSPSTRPNTWPTKFDNMWRLQCYRTKGVLEGAHLRLYFLQAPRFEALERAGPNVSPTETNIEVIGDAGFLKRTTPELRAVYQKIVTQASDASQSAPVIHVEMLRETSEGADSDVTGVTVGEEVDSVLLMIGVKAGMVHSYFSGTPDVYRWYGFFAVAKYVEVFANGVMVFNFHLRLLDFARAAASGMTPAPSGFGAPGAHVPSFNIDSTTPGGAGPMGHGFNSSSGLAELGRGGAGEGALDRRMKYTSTGPDAPSLQERISDLIRDLALHSVLPRTSVTPLLSQGALSAQEVAYAYAAWKFAFHFLPRMSSELQALISILKSTSASALGPDQSEALALVSKLRKNVQSHVYTEAQVLDVIFRFPSIISWLYDQFAAMHKPGRAAGNDGPGAGAMPFPEGALQLKKLLKGASDEDAAILTAFLTFNQSILKTNFYKMGIVALSFRLKPTFLSADYPDVPFGIFYVIGGEFRGFHVRFMDVARGGIRLIKSVSPQAFTNNVNGLFDECYNLALTQQKKNKDIPEGGSKGVILLNLGHQDKDWIAFRKYIDSILDILLTPHPEVVDHMGGVKEILFFGPDENTSDKMDWACGHARLRGYPFWKSVTTGKSGTLGGIPHDEYGMTTRGVRAYVNGIQRKLGLDPTRTTLTKMQTGGPDGDLGSNEIKLANETTVAVVDGSGVLCDMDGINRKELVRLAEGRKMVEHFNMSLLGPRGFFVGVKGVDVALPNGAIVPSGMTFRNNFHLNRLVSGIDFFVPCGGRPAAVGVENVEAFLYGAAVDGVSPGVLPTAAGSTGDSLTTRSAVPRFKYIVEGANLFFTNEARLLIERQGVMLFKDSSANKGGVTSSSLEVLAALSLTDEEFTKHMCVGADHVAPPFYQRYVAEVQRIIEANAEAEFECLWREHEATKIPLSTLSDKLSIKITDLSSRVETSDSMWHNQRLRDRVLLEAIPRELAALVGGAHVILQRLPDNYKRALFGAHLASKFIYTVGLDTPEFAFFEYVDRLLEASTTTQ